ncbi:MAG: hypothetical protein KC777_24875 [Cyanobacteria bacterium HKST-UBA02]|nr:hypothetical protein [Cyanobacteria bacterium HKST-UBA02]
MIVRELLPGKEQIRRRPETVSEACMSLGSRSSALETALVRLLVLNFSIARYDAAEIWGEILVLFLEALYGNKSRRRAMVLSILATTKYLLRKYGEAQSVFNEGLVMATELDIDPSNPVVTAFFKGLGASLCAQGKRKHGRLYCRLASVSCIHQKTESSNRKSIDELLDIALLYCESNDFSTAASICNKTIEDYRYRGARDLPSLMMTIADMLEDLEVEHGVTEIRARVARILLAT